jgi:hypothetical protein
VLSLPPSVRIFVATQPVDGRKGVDSLMAIVRSVLSQDPLNGHLRCDRVRVVYWDRNGFASWTKRLECGRLHPTFDATGRLSASAIEAAELAQVIPPKTPLGKAINYLVRQWHRLGLFMTDGRIELTNNRVERELRSLVLGRKNWLFAYGDLGGERTATILTIVGTCIAQRINPRAYLHAVTKLIVNGWPNARLRELLPDRIGEHHPELRLPSGASPPPALPVAA